MEYDGLLRIIHSFFGDGVLAGVTDVSDLKKKHNRSLHGRRQKSIM